MAPGYDILTTIGTNFYSGASGTSLAAPQVSGVLALLKGQFPSDNYHALINRLLASTDPVQALADTCVTSGRLNAKRALDTASSAPANDSLCNAFRFPTVVPSGAAGISATGNNEGASKQANEPNHQGMVGGRSVWWKWQAPQGNPLPLPLSGELLVFLYKNGVGYESYSYDFGAWYPFEPKVGLADAFWVLQPAPALWKQHYWTWPLGGLR